MEIKAACDTLSALAQETRLEVFRLLIRQGPDGLNAGDIARLLNVAPATLSFHLGQLERAGLIASRRLGRQIFYAADLEGTRRLIGFLTEDCCQGRPELCGGLPGSPVLGRLVRKSAVAPLNEATMPKGEETA